jgi:hypothetical protein
MTSHLANLFTALQTLIAGLVDDDGNAYFHYIDQDLGQLESDHPPVLWPCVLLDIDDVVYQSLGNNVQTGIATVKFRIGFPPFTSSSSIEEERRRLRALYYYTLEFLLHRALQGTVPSYIEDGHDLLAPVFGHFDRIAARSEHRSDTIRVRALTYTIGLQDYSTLPTIIYIPAAIDLNVDIDV